MSNRAEQLYLAYLERLRKKSEEQGIPFVELLIEAWPVPSSMDIQLS